MDSDSTAQSKDAPANIVDAYQDAPFGLIVCRPDGEIIAGNRSAWDVLNLDDSTIGTSVIEIAGCSEEEYREAASTEPDTRDSLRFMQDHGPTIEAIVQHVAGPDGATIGLWFKDTKRELVLRETLLHSERLSALGEIVAGVAHEINNPLTGILGNAQLLQQDSLTDAQRTRVDRIINESERCQAIVKSLLGFASGSSTEKRQTDINELTMTMLTLCGYQLRTDDIEVTTDFAKDLPRLMVDSNAVARALLNITHNAQQALNEADDRQRTIHVSTQEHDGMVCIRMQDNGTGIAPDVISRIFNPFFTTRTFGEGAGLGLSVAYGAARDHGGDIIVESEPGAGATFTIRLPIT